MKALFDTNILIDYLGGLTAAKDELDRYKFWSISVITWIEVPAGAKDDKDEVLIRRFLTNFRKIPLDDEIAEQAVKLRQSHRIKLPDAVIWATAQTLSMPLVTRNEKDFPPTVPSIRLPYRHMATKN